MSNNSMSDWSTSPASNIDIAGTNIGIGCPPADVGIFMRTIMAQLAYAVQGTGGTIPDEWHTDNIIAGTGTLGTLDITNTGTSGLRAVNYAAFAPVIANPGRFSIPGNLTVKFGSTVVSTDGAGQAAIFFSPAFSGGLLVAIAVNGDATATLISPQVFAPLATGFAFVVPGYLNSPYRVNWLAIGV
jgi:hypothetical protein